MGTNDEQPIMTGLEADTPDPQPDTPLQPWLRRFASVVGFASAGVSSQGGSQAMS